MRTEKGPRKRCDGLDREEEKQCGLEVEKTSVYLEKF